MVLGTQDHLMTHSRQLSSQTVRTLTWNIQVQVQVPAVPPRAPFAKPALVDGGSTAAAEPALSSADGTQVPMPSHVPR